MPFSSLFLSFLSLPLIFLGILNLERIERLLVVIIYVMPFEQELQVTNDKSDKVLFVTATMITIGDAQR